MEEREPEFFSVFADDFLTDAEGLFDTVPDVKSSVNESATPVFPVDGSTLTKTPEMAAAETVIRRKPKVLLFQASRVSGLLEASVPETGVLIAVVLLPGLRPVRL